MRNKQYFNAYEDKQFSTELNFVFCPKCGQRLEKKDIDGCRRNYCTECHYIQYINPLK
ncbi:hypothetical protein D1AOALGA4SA_9898 [Olavius algarvensis Delta 1 endosymbiont]|nr:hypothetical protein D1AOALGA4SA_9898 [Olavius algarvensis Delta 1 endosymbiont]